MSEVGARTDGAGRENLLVPGIERWPLDESKPVIELVEVSKAFGDEQVLDGLSLKIVPGMTTVVVGRSGSGKSVLLKLMMGLIEPDSGTIRLFGKEIDDLSQTELIALRKRMSMLFQNYALFDSIKVEDNVGFSLLENSKMDREDIMRRAHDLLRTLGLEGKEQMMPSALSGGMRKRVSLARALIANPEVVLFRTSRRRDSNPIMIEKVDEMILMARKEFQITSVIISHDMASTKRLADRVAFLHDGQIIQYGTFDDFVSSDLEPIRKLIDGAQTSRLLRAEGGHAAAPSVARREEAAEKPIVELRGVHKSFGDNHVSEGRGPCRSTPARPPCSSAARARASP